MPTYFECDYCNQRQEMGQFDASCDFASNCPDCGQDMCTLCSAECRRCDPCQKIWEDDMQAEYERSTSEDI